MTGPTPAPWKREGALIIGAEGTPDGQAVCQLMIGNGEPIGLGTMHAGRTDANGKLIVAAHDLAKALQGLLRAFDQLMPGLPYIAAEDYANINEAPIDARAALAKAGFK